MAYTKEQAAAYMRAYYAKNKEKLSEQARKSRLARIEKDPEKQKQLAKANYEKNKDKAAEKRKTWVKENPEKAAEQSRKKYLAHADYYREKSKEWKKLNADRNLAAIKKWQEDNKDKVREYNRVSDARNPERIQRKRRHHTDTLTDSYVSAAVGLKVKDCPPGLIELKREQLTIKRLSRQIKQTTKAHNETSTNIS